MIRPCIAAICVFLVVPQQPSRAKPPAVEKHVLVFGEDGKFAGWPAGHGMWSWGNEILVGFSVGAYKNLNSGHKIDRDQPELASITPICPAAEWIEREMWELLGITFTDHPDLRHLLLEDDWPEGKYPLRRDYRRE